MNNHTALSLLRTLAATPSNQEGLLPTLIRVFHEQKKFSPIAAKVRPDIVSAALRFLLFRNASDTISNSTGFILRASNSAPDATLPINKYRGTPFQNGLIDRSLTLYNGNKFFGEGAASLIDVPSIVGTDEDIKDTPIGIIGAGAAGIITYAALRVVGFRNISIFEKRAQLGIWSQPNVFLGTKNNPRTLTFSNIAELKTARGDGVKDGKEVVDFLRRLIDVHTFPNTNKINIDHVYPSDLSQDITDGRTLPILINAMGTGSPREFDDRSRMSLFPGSERPLGVRWQVADLTRGDVEGKQFLFIGLGNSTAEMISQLNTLRSKGANCDYKIATHYPRDSIFNPNETVETGHKTYRVFRDLTRPDLTGFQGDLARSRVDYYQALTEDRILPDVTSWGVKNGKVTLRSRGKEQVSFPADKIFVLTGYQHEYDSLSGMGIYAPNGYPEADYDGELRNDEGQVIKGYFGIGAVMDAPHNRNATVIPGIMFRLPDMLYSIIMRAIEYQLAKGKLQ